MKPVIVLNKNPGETPLECLERFRLAHPEYKDIALSYMGRLDPLAEGVIVVVVGEENKNRLAYLGLPKEYIVDILFGFETDTGDPLGLVTAFSSSPETSEEEIQKKLKQFEGIFLKEYPVYSSKTVNGKPLFQWAREGRLHEIEIPKRKVAIFSLKIISTNIFSKKELLTLITEKINSVNGDFRQHESLQLWEETIKKHPLALFSSIKIQVTCGSGVYMRQFANELGVALQSHAIALHIKRIKVGEYTLDAVAN